MKTKVWAHRGASAYAPENTLEAFSLAAKQGADGVELDVQMTKDQKLVVIHDERIDRVSDAAGWVRDFALEELKRFSFNRTHPEYVGAKIPTLAEVYELLRPTSLTVNVELKTGIFPYPGIEEAVLRLSEQMGMRERVIYSSFGHQSLVKLKELDSSVVTGLLYSDGWIGVPSYAKQVVKVDALHPALYHMQDEELLTQAKKLGLKVHVWTVNEKAHMEQLVHAGVDAIITNYPDIARKVVDREDER